MFPDFTFHKFSMHSKVIQGQFIVAEYDTVVILDNGHVWKAVDASKINYFLQKMLKTAYFKHNMGIFGIILQFSAVFPKKVDFPCI